MNHHCSRRLQAHLAAFICWQLGIFPAVAQADIDAEIGYAQLVNEYQSELPVAAGFPVMMVESDRNPDPQKISYAPDAGHRELRDIRISVGEGGPAVYAPFSSHATDVARQFFGRTSSVAPEVNQVASYLTDDWYSTRFLRLGDARQPKKSVSRVACHAWVGLMDWQQKAFNPLNNGALRRVDWLVETDDSIQVVGFNGADRTPLLGDAFNVIAVSQTDLDQQRNTLAIDGTYQADRTLPHLVVPEDSPSASTARTASVAALLVAVGHQNPELSNGETKNRAGQQIFNAERSEVIRSVLLAGASRRTDDITDFRQQPEQRTHNGMDHRYGAGQLNVYHSYRILAGGEHDSAEDAESAGPVGGYGFDYDEAFGGLGDSNRRAAYRLVTGESGGRLTVSLTWNININGGSLLKFDPRAKLYDLDLALYDVTVGEPALVAASRSRKDNSENIQAELEAGRTYEMIVVPGPGDPDFAWDYAIAWRLDITP